LGGSPTSPPMGLLLLDTGLLFELANDTRREQQQEEQERDQQEEVEGEHIGGVVDEEYSRKEEGGHFLLIFLNGNKFSHKSKFIGFISIILIGIKFPYFFIAYKISKYIY
jgi:hypothetical protein